MSTENREAAILATALDAARSSPSPVLVMPNNLLGIPGAREAFVRLAKETGKMFGLQPRDPSFDAALAAQAARDARLEKSEPIVRSDSASFLANMAKIARGEVKVK